MYSTNTLWEKSGTIYRVLENDENNSLLVIDCIRQCNPMFVLKKQFEGAKQITEAELQARAKINLRTDLNEKELAETNKRYMLISGIIPVIGDSQERCSMLRQIAKLNGYSIRGLKKWLYRYLAFQDKAILAPKKAQQKELTPDQKNFRWALNKFFYTRHGKSLTDTYYSLIRERYCESNGTIKTDRPSIHQFRYFFYKNRKIQTELISRSGLKDYQMNHRPLLGNGVQEFAPCIGTGMLDSTICDIYLCNSQGIVVGRPILTACIDGYSGLCCGYYLGWEGGMYSVRELILNIIADKTKLCKSFGIEIKDEDWPCKELPSIMVTDRGSEYASFNFEQLAELGVTIINLPPFRPELKGRVEKFFDLIQNAYKPYLKGKGVIESDFQKRGGHDYRKDACISLHDFETIIIHAIIFHNTKRVLKNFPYTAQMLDEKTPPYSASIWEFQKKHGLGNLIFASPETITALLLPRTTGNFTRKGLIVNGLRYGSDGFAERFLKGNKVKVAFNPDNVTYVYLVDENFKRFELIDTQFDGAKLDSVNQTKTAQKEHIKHFYEDSMQGRIDLISHIQTIVEQGAITPKKSLKAIGENRRIEKYETHKDFITEVKNDD